MTTPQAPFVHLSVHTDYSLSDSLVRVDELMKAVKALGMPAVAVADSANMFAAIRAYSKASATGIKPVVGMELLVRSQWGDGIVTLLAQNDRGYKNLIRLASKAQTTGKLSGTPGVPWNDFIAESDGLILLSGARRGVIGRLLLARRGQDLRVAFSELQKAFGDRLYLELQRTGHEDDNEHVRLAAEFARTVGAAVVATNTVLFLNRENYETHCVRAAVAKGITVQALKSRDMDFTPEQYLKSPKEMSELFSDIPSAIANSHHIAARCSVEISLGKSYLPTFPTPDKSTEEEFLMNSARQGLAERLIQLYPDATKREQIRGEYESRLEFELGVIKGMGFPGYFLIVADFIQWSKDNGIAVGPGRGSGAGSLVAYSLKITELDPLAYDLLFERFLNPERVSMPDFDVDFCMDNRDRVIDYVARKYGRDAVSQIITYGTMAARMVVRDVARALGHPFGFADRISKMIPDTLGITLDEAMVASADMKLAYDTDPEVREVLEHSLVMEGLTRQVGKHAGGVLIAPTRLIDFTPVYSDEDGSGLVSQFDKDDVESAGLVKFDFLGLRTLTIIQWAVDSVNKKLKAEGKAAIDINHIDMRDVAVFELLHRCETTAVFQLESSGMKSLIKRLKPDTFEEIIALVALFRPGPLEAGMVDDFVNRKHGRSEVEYLHPLLEDILKNTYGVFVYQEQVMKTAQVLAGYTLGQADMLRRAMGKKKPEEMAQQRQIFIDGSVGNGIERTKAAAIFDLMEKFAGYGFNKSHSAAYALIAYQTAWLKAHYPAEFMAAVLSSDMGNTDKLVSFVHECKKIGIAVLAPDINQSDRSFTAVDSRSVRYGLEGIKGLGGAALVEILTERSKNGPFKSLFDLCHRANPNKRCIEAAICSGALDGMRHPRWSLMASIEKAQATSRALATKKKHQANDLFANDESNEFVTDNLYMSKGEPWPALEQLHNERRMLGHYLTGHPLDQYRKELDSIVSESLSDVLSVSIDAVEGEASKIAQINKGMHITFAGLVVESDVSVRNNGHFARVKVDDGTRRVDVMVFNKAYGECFQFIHPDAIIIVDGTIRYDARHERYRIVGNRIMDIAGYRDNHLARVDIERPQAEWTQEEVESFSLLRDSLSEGGTSLTGKRASDSHATLLHPMRIRVTDNVLGQLQKIFGESAVKMSYSRAEKADLLFIDEESNSTSPEDRRQQRRERVAQWLERATTAMMK